MFSRGNSSSMANNKGKEIMVEVEDKQEGNNGSFIANNKGKEIMVEAEEEQDELLEALELLQGKEIMMEAEEENNGMAEAEEEEQDGNNDGSPLLLQAEEAPQWLQVLMRARFWRECRVHGHGKLGLRRAEESVFCVHCFKVICPHCRHAQDEPTHRVLKIRHYVFRSVVSTRDMNSLGVDISYIQAYKCNGHNVVHLRPIKRSAGHRAPPETPRCIICDCLLHTLPSRLCSLSCKHRIRRQAASTDDLSGPRASRRLARQGGQGEATSRRPGGQGEATSRRRDAQGEATSRPAGRRPRKMANPRRAPFF